MRTSRLACVVALAIGLLPLASAATPVVYTISDKGLVNGCAGNNASSCGTLNNFVYSAPNPPPNAFDPATGTLTFDTVSKQLDIAMSIVSATFLSSSDYQGVDEVIFTAVSYSKTGLNFNQVGTSNVYNVAAGQTVSISGTYEQKNNGAQVVAPTAFGPFSATVSAGQCVVETSSSTLSCGLTFGTGGFGAFSIGAGPNTRQFRHVFEVVAVPEPGTFVLVAAGLLALHTRRRRP
jgi:hypothetical protein